MNSLQARDVMLKIFKDAWNPAYPVVWQDKTGRPPNNDTAWARVILRYADGGQSSLAGEIGTRRFTDSGILMIQIFTLSAQGMDQALELADLVQNAYEDAREEVWFRGVRKQEGGEDGIFNVMNVFAEFNYDHVR